MIPLSGRTRTGVDPGTGSIFGSELLNKSAIINALGLFKPQRVNAPQIDSRIQVSGRDRFAHFFSNTNAAKVAAIFTSNQKVNVTKVNNRQTTNTNLGNVGTISPIQSGPALLTIGQLTRFAIVMARRTIALAAPVRGNALTGIAIRR